ncbi:hypothetical protein HPB47_003436, partial [Ixodes persulcatus]
GGHSRCCVLQDCCEAKLGGADHLHIQAVAHCWDRAVVRAPWVRQGAEPGQNLMWKPESRRTMEQEG